MQLINVTTCHLHQHNYSIVLGISGSNYDALTLTYIITITSTKKYVDMKRNARVEKPIFTGNRDLGVQKQTDSE